MGTATDRIRLHDHVTNTDVLIQDLTDEALCSHVQRVTDPAWRSFYALDSLEAAHPIYAQRRNELVTESARRL